MFLDQLVRRFTAEPTIDRSGQYSGGGEEGKVAAQLGFDDRREDPELVEHAERGLDEAVGGHERIGQHDPPHDGAAHVALVPLTAGQARRHREMAVDHELETVDPFRASGVHLVRHRRGADLARAEALGRQLVTSHEAKRGGRARRSRDGLRDRRHDVEVERTGIHLADRVEHPRETEVFGNRLLELVDPIGIPEQIELVETSADRALQTAEWVASKEFLDPLKPDHRLFRNIGKPLAEGGGLGGDVVGAGDHHLACVALGERREAGKEGDETVAHDLERSPDLELLDVLGEITRGHSPVDVFVTGQRAELVDAGLDVVAGD